MNQRDGALVRSPAAQPASPASGGSAPSPPAPAAPAAPAVPAAPAAPPAPAVGPAAPGNGGASGPSSTQAPTLSNPPTAASTNHRFTVVTRFICRTLRLWRKLFGKRAQHRHNRV